MSEQHWHKWLSGEEWVKMGPFPNEQACPYCRVERAEARVEELGGTVDAQVVSIERLQARVKELEGILREEGE